MGMDNRTNRYAVLIDHGSDGLSYVKHAVGVVWEVETLIEALIIAADNSYSSPWEIVQRIDIREQAPS